MDNPEKNKTRESVELEAIKMLEDVSFLPPNYKLVILAVYLDLKPISDLDFLSHEDLSNVASELSELKDILEKMNIFYKVSYIKPRVNLQISKDESSLGSIELTREEFNRLGFKKYHTKIGKNMKKKFSKIFPGPKKKYVLPHLQLRGLSVPFHLHLHLNK